MLFNHLKLAFRNLFNNKIYSFINLSGLAIGIASSIFIALFVIHEFSYDRFHEKADRIYRIGVKGQMMGSEINQAITAAPMGAAILQDYPEVENMVRIRKFGDWLVRYGEKKFHEEDFLFADSTFFEVFDFKLLRGDPHTVLDEPKTVVLTESIAKKYFGDEDPIGKMLHLETDTTYFRVTGIMEDVPTFSHFTFNMVGSVHTYGASRSDFWVSHNFYTYILLRENIPWKELEKKLNSLIEKYVGPQIEEALGIDMEQFYESGNTFGYFLQPLKSIHLGSDLQYEFEPTGNKTLVYIFIFIAALILIVASINFMNLSTARSAGRAKEVGIKKVSGSSQQSLIFQFLFESVITSLVSLLIAVGLVELLLPSFNNLIQLSLNLDYFEYWWIIPFLLIFGITVGIFAGTYPAFVLASFKPTVVLKGSLTTGIKGSLLRRILVVGQFTVSIIILLGTFVTNQQVKYILNKDIGFDKEDVLVIRRSDALDDQIDAFKEVLMNNPAIKSVTNANSIPGRNFSNNAIFKEGESTANTYLVWQSWVNYGFAETFSLELKEGRFFSKEMASDSSAIVLNESAVKSLGLENPIGKRLMQPSGPNTVEYLTIIGVLKDFNFQSLHKKIEPMGFILIPGNWEGYIPVKLTGTSLPETVEYMKQTWEDFNQDYPFDYFWMEDDFVKQYETEIRTGKILSIFSLLSLFIASLGLFGLISFTAEKRTKEIGIRKSLGATISSVLFLLSKETVSMVGIAAIISIPFYFVIKIWLQDFAFHFNFNVAVFAVWYAVTVFIILVIALITVSFVTIGAAQRNPADSLRYE